MLKNLAYVIAAGVILLWVVFMLMKVYTNHGKEFELPDFTGLYPDEVGGMEGASLLRFEIIDTIFSDTHQRGTIASQSPPPDSKVKKGRRVFLTVVSDEPEKVQMPNVMNLTLRLASATLESYGLRIGVKEYVPSAFKNAVLDQKYHGNHIEPGTEILKGSIIDLDIGQGLGNEKTAVPNLLGLSRSEVAIVLSETSLNLGTEFHDDEQDTLGVRVYRQSPRPSSRPSIRQGTTIDLWYRKGTIEEFEALRREFIPDTMDSDLPDEMLL